MHPGPPAPRLCSQVILVSWGMAVWSHQCSPTLPTMHVLPPGPGAHAVIFFSMTMSLA